MDPENDRENAEPACAISYGFWQRRFGSDRSAGGRVVQIDGSPFTIIGITAPEQSV
ncbi:MAG: ABC transporter permease [Bryobacteraceae bacterium]